MRSEREIDEPNLCRCQVRSLELEPLELGSLKLSPLQVSALKIRVA